jgi:hypothetical protein
MASKYELRAEEIIGKLSLIDENKNFLQYPYNKVFPTGLVDVGDGSILTSDTSADQSQLVLGPALLAAGDYKVSLAITTITEEAVNSHGFSLTVEGDGVSRVDDVITVTTDETTVIVTLNIPNEFSTNWLIKPQIVKLDEDSTVWVPYMKTIGTYVDERFNGTNARLKVIAERLENTGQVQLITWEE